MKEKLTILHSNDIHGDFLSKEENGKKTGGLALLSGYVGMVSLKKKNLIYALAGDMFRGSIIDSEYKGLSTIELMNMMLPDVGCVGNHEIDYGVAHALFVEKCAHFPIINANLRISTNWRRLMEPYVILERGRLKIMFISVVTKDVMDSINGSEKLLSPYVETEDYAESIGVVCDMYKTPDINCVVLLTHIGLEEDKKLAQQLRPEWGVNLIIGGHSHTFMEEPVYVNGIPIVQAGTGSGQIGHAELTIDTETGKTESFRWKTVPIDSDSCPENPVILAALEYMKADVDTKYEKVLCVLERELTHPARNQETEMGNLFADLLLQNYNLDVVMVGSGSLRKTAMGPIVTKKDLNEIYPFDDEHFLIKVNGEQLKRMVRYILREEAFVASGDTEFYQFSRGCRFVWSRGRQEFLEFSLNGKEIGDEQILQIGLAKFHLANFTKFFNVPIEEIEKNGKPRMIASNVVSIIEELFVNSKKLNACVEGRIDIRD